MCCLCLEEVLLHIKESVRYLNYFWGVIRERRTRRLNVNVFAVKQWSLTSLSLYRKGCAEVEWPEMDTISSLTNRDLCGAEFELGHRWSYRKILWTISWAGWSELCLILDGSNSGIVARIPTGHRRMCFVFCFPAAGGPISRPGISNV